MLYRFTIFFLKFSILHPEGLKQKLGNESFSILPRQSFLSPFPLLLRRGLQMWPAPRAVGGRTAVTEGLPRCPTNEDIKSPIKRLELPPGDPSRAFSGLE